MLTRTIIAVAAVLLTPIAAYAQNLQGRALPTRPYNQLTGDELKAAGLPAKLSPAFAHALSKVTPEGAVAQPMDLHPRIQTGNMKRATGISADTLVSTNWSGEILAGGGQPESTSVVVAAPPAPVSPNFVINPPPDGYYCAWAGQNGVTTTPLWQAGYCVTSSPTALGPTTALTFLECYPQDPFIIALFPINIGDAVYYTVWANGDGTGTAYVQDLTTGTYYFNPSYNCNPPSDNTETIVENPGGSFGLAPYGTLLVSGADNVTTGVGFGDPSAEDVYMISESLGGILASAPTKIDETDIEFDSYPGSPPPSCTACQPPPPPPPPPVPPKQPKQPRQPVAPR